MNTTTMHPDEIRALVANGKPIEQTIREYRTYTFTPGLDPSPAAFRHKLGVLAFICKESFKIIEMERSVRSPEATANALKVVAEISEETESLLAEIS